jgi:hypothetical protein
MNSRMKRTMVGRKVAGLLATAQLLLPSYVFSPWNLTNIPSSPQSFKIHPHWMWQEMEVFPSFIYSFYWTLWMNLGGRPGHASLVRPTNNSSRPREALCGRAQTTLHLHLHLSGCKLPHIGFFGWTDRCIVQLIYRSFRKHSDILCGYVSERLKCQR